MAVREAPERALPKPSQPRLERVAFTTSRLLDFVGVRELTAQIGHPPEEWPLVILKELVDNAIDGAEDARVAPIIDVAVDTTAGTITVADNGPGLMSETIERVIDFTVRVSSREAYVSPSRGQQGNALKTLIAMPFALDGTDGVTTIIESRGRRHDITFTVDPVRREPRISHAVTGSDVQIGTGITLRWPAKASHLLVPVKARFVQLAGAYTTFNPHLVLRARWDGEQTLDIPATAPAWQKWRTADPTSAYWYSIDAFERYAAAHVAREEDTGRSGRMVRDFIGELRGLARSGKQKLVLAETDAGGVPLARFFARGRSAIAELLSACQRHTQPVKPELLGLIGADHLRTDCASWGGAVESFRYAKRLGTTSEGLPYAIEAAFAYASGASQRLIVTGINFSVAIGNPFERVYLGQVLAQQMVQRYDPVIFVLHYTCPRVEFVDRGKGAVALLPAVVEDIADLACAVTKEWARQRQAEMKSAAAEGRRTERLLRERQRPEKKVPAEPSGVLAEKLIVAAGEQSLDTLAVLSPGNDPYLAYRRRREAEWFTEWFDLLVPEGAAKHLRGFFYLLVSTPAVTGPDGKPFRNDEKHWQMVLVASKAARWLGLIPFERLIDERNAPPEIFVPAAAGAGTVSVSTGTCCVVPTAATAMPTASLLGFAGRQRHRIVFYGEKVSLSVVLRPIAEQIGAEMILATGESSDTLIAGMARRAAWDGRPTAVFYFSDFDPSGHQMPVSVSRKLQALCDLGPGHQISLRPVALTLEQVRDLGLPSSPLKATEKRARQWQRAHGGLQQTEIDAMIELHPAALRQATFAAIDPFYDDTLGARTTDAVIAWRKDADRALRGHPGYDAGRKRISAAVKRARTAAVVVDREQARLARLLNDRLPPAPAVPEAKPTGEAPPALFDSAEDFVTATRRLIRHKKLMLEQ